MKLEFVILLIRMPSVIAFYNTLVEFDRASLLEEMLIKYVNIITKVYLVNDTRI